MREIINGSFEPLWRKNAREDADKFKSDLMRAPTSRRTFLAGAGAALLLEYVAARRAVAFPFPHGAVAAAPPASGTIYNARLGPGSAGGVDYQYMKDAFFGMQSGDTLILPAGTTYQYASQTYHYAHTNNYNWLGFTWNTAYLGATADYGGTMTADYGSVQALGTANNGRALLSPAYGILASDYTSGDNEMFLDPTTPVTNWGAFLFGIPSSPFAASNMGFSGINIPNNSFTGAFGPSMPAGTIVTSWLNNRQGILVMAGQNPGWTFTNIEFAYANNLGDSTCSINQHSGHPGGPYIGSFTMNNCYIHDCAMGAGIGYAGIGSDNGIFARMFDTEVYHCGMGGQMHNLYIGHISEFTFDNSYSHAPTGAWALKSRAAMNLITYSQIRGERTSAYTSLDQGCDFANGGLIYAIGSIIELSRNPGNGATINLRAEFETSGDWSRWTGSPEGGALNPIDEQYLINCTLVGSDTGALLGPIQLYFTGPSPPPVATLGQTAQSGGTTLPARQYYASFTATGTSGGETIATPLATPVADAIVSETLNINSGNVLTIQSPPQPTGTSGWNWYANYGDPPIFVRPGMSFDSGVYFYWDAGFTQPLFSTTSGGTTVSVTGTLTNGSSFITGVAGLVGFASLYQLLTMALYVDGVYSGLAVTGVDPSTSRLGLNGNWAGSTGTPSITFGSLLFCGVTYQTALGESVNSAMDFTSWGNGWFTGRSFIQVDPGQKLVVHAPPSGPSWATGVNFYATQMLDPGIGNYTSGPWTGIDGWVFGMTKQNTSLISFNTTWTSPASLLAPKAQQDSPNLYLQNAAPLSFGADVTEPNTGLVNNLNPSQSKLQWFRRAAMVDGNGSVVECWYAVVPGGGLSSYSDTIYLNKVVSAANGSVCVFRGCAATPFDANFGLPAINPATNSTSITTAAGNVTVLAANRANGATAGVGFTQISTQYLLNAYYASFVGAQTNLVVTESVSGSFSYDTMVVDALAGTSAAPTLISSVTITATSTTAINFTVPSANAGDILYLVLGTSDVGNVCSIGKVSTPPVSTAVGIAPIIKIQNCIAANYNGTTTGGWAYSPYTNGAIPGANLTVTTSLQANPFNGAIFGSPTWATVFADATQSDFDYRLAVSSPAKNSASDPGSVHSQDLIPHYQVSWQGLPTPGTPIPAKAARTDIGPALTGSIGALT